MGIFLCMLLGGAVTVGAVVWHSTRPSAALPSAGAASAGLCPVCRDEALGARAGHVGERRCARCGGAWLDADGARDLVFAPRGIEPGQVSEVATGRGVAAQCPACARSMRPILLDDEVADVCVHCGALWCDSGELSRLTGGRTPA